jgi:DHA3 family macrolide efflux protein-like MFS transporter
MFWHALASIFLVGVTVSMIDGPIAAVMQSTVPPETQGRVLGLVMSLSSPATPIGLAVAGPVGDAMGIPFWFKLAGVSDEYRSWCDLRVDSGV